MVRRDCRDWRDDGSGCQLLDDVDTNDAHTLEEERARRSAMSQKVVVADQ
jgi:hypothetical protein